MATAFVLLDPKKEGMVPIYARIQSRKLKVNIRISTNILVSSQKWNLSRDGITFKNFKKSEEGAKLFTTLEEIEKEINYQLDNGVALKAADARKIIDGIIYKEQRIEQQRKEEEQRKKEEEAKRMTLNKFIDLYLKQAENGTRKTQKGTNFSEGTIKSLRLVRNQFLAFQKEKKKKFDFDDIDYEFRTKFQNFLFTKKKYNINTAAKCINTLITILTAAEAEGHHNNRKCIGKQFRAKRIDVDSIYLTKEELKAIMNADISNMSDAHIFARDIFMVGVYTAQRVSDYNNIGPENIIRNGDGSIIINLRQKKTGIWVSIPAKEELKAILEKYDYTLPHIAEQTINDCIKEVAKKAEITTPVTIETTTGGKVSLETHPKYELIHTHTARRTGATLMYLAGMNVFNICSVTGHSSIAMLKKYIKADELEKAKTISSDAAFTKW